MKSPSLRSFVAALVFLASLFSFTTAPAQSKTSLERAYKKEFSYLEAQKRAAKTRLAALKKSNASKLGSAQRQVDRLQGRVLDLQRKADTLEQELSDVGRDVEAADADDDVLVTTLEQARASLKELGVDLEDIPDTIKDPEQKSLARAKRLDEALASALDKLESFQTRTQNSGSFFAQDGKKVEGTIIQIGRIASYGLAAHTSGALAPAGAGRLKLWTPETQESLARSQRSVDGFVKNVPTKMVGIFLYESLKKNGEEKEEKTWSQYLEGGGLTGYVIVVLGIIGAVLVLFRFLFLMMSSLGAKHLLRRLSPLLERGQYAQALLQARRNKTALGRVLASTLVAVERSREELEDVVSEALLHEYPRLERFGTTITVFAAVAPLLGLLGTVTGMISTFDIITEFGTGDPRMLSGGISEALITTQLGLIVAIPLLLLGNMTSGLARGVQTELERACLQVMNRAVDLGDEAVTCCDTDGGV